MQPFLNDLWLMDSKALRQMEALAVRMKWVLSAESVGELSALDAQGNRLSPRLPREEQSQGSSRTSKKQKNVAILPVCGPIEARRSFLGELLGMTSAEKIGSVFDSLMEDDSINAVMLDISSPGGMVYGTPELANKIYAARGRKPVIAVANPAAFSGAYWLASAADRVVVSPSGDVGSVGVMVSHLDLSKALEQKGIKEEIIRSQGSPFKVESNEVEPLTDEARSHLQGRVDRIYDNFVSDLAKFRGVSEDQVRERFGKGRIVDAQAAVRVGMADHIGTLKETAIRLMEGRIRLGATASEDNWDAPTKREQWKARSESLAEVAGMN